MLGHLDVSNLANIYMYVLKTQKPVITWTNSFLSNSVQRSYRMQHEYCQTRTPLPVLFMMEAQQGPNGTSGDPMAPLGGCSLVPSRPPLMPRGMCS